MKIITFSNEKVNTSHNFSRNTNSFNKKNNVLLDFKKGVYSFGNGITAAQDKTIFDNFLNQTCKNIDEKQKCGRLSELKSDKKNSVTNRKDKILRSIEIIRFNFK